MAPTCCVSKTTTPTRYSIHGCIRSPRGLAWPAAADLAIHRSKYRPPVAVLTTARIALFDGNHIRVATITTRAWGWVGEEGGGGGILRVSLVCFRLASHVRVLYWGSGYLLITFFYSDVFIDGWNSLTRERILGCDRLTGTDLESDTPFNQLPFCDSFLFLVLCLLTAFCRNISIRSPGWLAHLAFCGLVEIFFPFSTFGPM